MNAYIRPRNNSRQLEYYLHEGKVFGFFATVRYTAPNFCHSILVQDMNTRVEERGRERKRKRERTEVPGQNERRQKNKKKKIR